MNTRTRSPFKRFAVSVVALTTFTAFGGALGATAAWGAVRGDGAPNSYLRALSHSATEADQIPGEGDSGRYAEGAGLIYETSRYLGGTKTSSFWVVENDRGNICLVLYLDQSKDSSMVCVTPDVFRIAGISGAVAVGVESTEGDVEKDYVEAYLLPDSLHFTTMPEGLNAISSNLIAGDSRKQSGELIAKTSDGRAEMKIQLIQLVPES